MEGLAPIPRQIEGVWVGVTLRQKPDGNFKVSVRTGNHADAADICGGWAAAAMYGRGLRDEPHGRGGRRPPGWPLSKPPSPPSPAPERVRLHRGFPLCIPAGPGRLQRRGGLF